MHDPVTDKLLDELGAVARLEVRVDTITADDRPTAPEDRWMTTPGAHRRDALLASFLATAPVRPATARRGARIAVLVLSAALAAAAALVLFWRPVAEQPAASDASLGYQLSVEGQVVAQRGDRVAAVAAFRSGEQVRLLLTPSAPVHERLDLLVIATHGAQRLDLSWRWHIDPQEGAIEVEGPVDDLLRAAAGTWTLTVELRDPAGSHELRERLSTSVAASP